MKRKLLSVLIAVVLGLSLMPTVPVSANPLTVSATPDNPTAGATTNYSITFTPATGEAANVTVDFSAFGITGTDMDLTEVSPDINDYSFTGFSVNATGVSANNTTKKIEFTGGNTTAAKEHTISGIGLKITNDQDAETQNVTISTLSDSGIFALTIDPGDAARLGVTDITTPIIKGTASNVKVTAYDEYENVATSYNGTIKFTSSDTEATLLPSSYTFPATDNGTCTFIDGITFNTVGEQWVTATDTAASSINGTQGDIYVYVIKVVTKKYYTETNLFGTEAWFLIGSNGEILKTIEATSEDGNLTVTIPEGTIALEYGKRLKSLQVDYDENPPAPPEDASIIGLAYDFDPDGATFDPPITLEYSYDPAEVPEGVAEEDLVIAYYDEEAGKWVACECTCDPETHCISACVCHFTTFAIIARAVPPPPPPAPAPAAFSLSNISIEPAEVQPKEAVTINVSVADTSGTEGSYTVVLKINGVKEAEARVTVAAGSTRDISFSVTKEEAGTYSVTADGLSGSFTVLAPPAPMPAPTPTPAPPAKPPINWPVIIAAVVIVGVLIYFLVIRRRA